MGKLIRNAIIGFFIVVLISMIMFANGERNEVVNQSLNVISAVDPRVQSIKNAVKADYGVTYEEAFTNYFGNPAWKGFVSDDGKDVVEFTGKCMFQDTRVTALIQFVINNEEETFEAVYLSFNDIPQNKLILATLITDVFDEAVADKDNKNDSPEEQQHHANKSNAVSESEQENETSENADIIDILVQRDCEYLADEYIPTIYIHGDGTFRFVCNLYEGIKDFVGIWEIVDESSISDYYFIVENDNGAGLNFHIHYDSSAQEGVFVSESDKFGMSVSGDSIFYSSMA